MKSISIFFVATASYSSRLSSIINNVNSGLLGYNFTTVSAERGFSYRYNFDESCAASWWAMLPSIYSSLRDNVIFLGGLPSSLPVSISDVEDYAALPKWLHPRELSNGDLSVISKHHQALKIFLNSKDDYALICEDDVIFAESAVPNIFKLAQGLSFDFIDIAGGDGLSADNPDTFIDNLFRLERKVNFSTRTACCYLISRRYASFLCNVLSRPIFPIDWSMSFAFSLYSTPPLVYWLSTPLAQHGSSIGKVNSWRSS